MIFLTRMNVANVSLDLYLSAVQFGGKEYNVVQDSSFSEDQGS